MSLFFAVMPVVVVAVFRALLPETRERTLEELEAVFRDRPSGRETA